MLDIFSVLCFSVNKYKSLKTAALNGIVGVLGTLKMSSQLVFKSLVSGSKYFWNFAFSSDEKKKSFLENLMGEDGNQITKNFYKIGYNQFVK